MQILANAPQMGIKDSAKILKDFDRNKEPGEKINKAQAEVIQMEQQRDRVDMLLGLSPKERFKQAPELYQMCYHEKFKENGIRGIEIFIQGACAAGFFIGAAAGGMNPLLFFGLIGTFWTGPAIIKGIALSKGKIDVHMQNKLKEERRDIESRIDNARASLKKMESAIMTGIVEEAGKSEAQAIEEEPDYIMIDGMKLHKRKNKLLELLNDIFTLPNRAVNS